MKPAVPDPIRTKPVDTNQTLRRVFPIRRGGYPGISRNIRRLFSVHQTPWPSISCCLLPLPGWVGLGLGLER